MHGVIAQLDVVAAEVLPNVPTTRVAVLACD